MKRALVLLLVLFATTVAQNTTPHVRPSSQTAVVEDEVVAEELPLETKEEIKVQSVTDLTTLDTIPEPEKIAVEVDTTLVDTAQNIDAPVEVAPTVVVETPAKEEVAPEPTIKKEVEEAPQEVAKEDPKKMKNEKSSASQIKPQKHFGIGVQFLNTGNTRTTNMRYEMGLILKGKNYHGVHLYHKIYNWDYNVGTVWGVNYDYKRRLGTKFIRLDAGATVGWNLYEEKATASYEARRHIRIGGPQADVNLFFGPVHIVGGYAYLMGYREFGVDDTRKYDGTHQFTLGFGIKMKKRK